MMFNIITSRHNTIAVMATAKRNREKPKSV